MYIMLGCSQPALGYKSRIWRSPSSAAVSPQNGFHICILMRALHLIMREL